MNSAVTKGRFAVVSIALAWAPAACAGAADPGRESSEAPVGDATTATADGAAPGADDAAVVPIFDAGAPNTDGGDPPPTAADGGMRCSGRTKPPADATWTLMSGGLSRTLAVHVPAGYDPTQPTPLVLNFHGQFSDGAQEDMLSGMSAKADDAGFIAVFPEGVGASWNAGGDCCDPALTENVDDVGFVEDILTAASAELCVDRARVFATGMSNGAYFAHRLGCALAGEIAAIAPVSGVLSVPPACEPSRPMPVMEFHGTADPVVPYDGGGTPEEPSVPATFAGWAMRDGCQGAPKATFQSGDVTCSSYEACNATSEVTLCTVDGGGHAWPGGLSVPLLGYTTTSISATDSMWSFFVAHPLH
jgi:polyhydroxybutyrate depolymerase